MIRNPDHVHPRTDSRGRTTWVRCSDCRKGIMHTAPNPERNRR